MSEKQITNRVKKLQALEEQKAMLEKQIAEVKGQIQSEMKESDKMKAGNFIVRWAYIFSNKLDTKALKSEHPEICEQFTRLSMSRRFSVSEAK